MINIAVIIPYFQKESGILRRALDSILKQQLPPDIYVEIIIIDDESPVPAITETDGLEFPPPFHHTIIKQRNGGVATARNTGLAHVSEGTTYIAFLDSDDIWTPEHLGRAITGLNLGYDYYFCDSQRIGEKQTTFAQSQFGKFLTPENKLLAGESLYKVNKEDFFDFSLIEWVSLIPTVVYRHAIAPKLTFRTSLRVAGEDCLFLLQLIKKSSAICYSSESLVTIADGVNIHASYSWDDPGHFMRYMCQILAFYEFRKHLSLSAKNDYALC